MRRVVLAAATALFATASTAWAGDTDPADLAFWQSIQSSTNPAEYQAYLDAFPAGKFAALAHIRVTTPPQPAVQSAPAEQAAAPADDQTAAADQTAQAAPATGDVGQGEKLVLDPPKLRVGQTMKLTCTNMPQPTTSDKIYVVTAGSPDADPSSSAGSGIKVLAYNYASECVTGVLEFGPFAPGNYEARFYTRLYNNDNRQEIATRTKFAVH
jgi:hypothetical protein